MKAIFLLASRNLTYRPGRSISCTLGIALGLAIVMAVLIVDHNTILTQTSMREQQFGDPDIEITPHRPDAARMDAQQDRILRCREIARATRLLFDTASLSSMAGRLIKDIKLAGLDEGAASGFNAYRVEEGEDLDFFGPPNVLLSRKTAEELNAGPGDIVRLWLDRPVKQVCKDGKIVPKKEEETRSPKILDFKVSGVLAEEHLGVGRMAVVPMEAGLGLYEPGMLLPVLWWAKLHTGAEVNLVKQSLKDLFSVDKPRRALVGESPEERAFRNGVRVCAMLSLLLGLYIIFNSMSMSLVERIRQIGLLRAMGITRAGLTQLFLLEGFFLTLGGCVLSIGFTALIVLYMTARRITTLGFGKPLHIIDIPWTELAGVMALGTVFSLLGIIYPVGKAWSLSVIQAIRKGTIEFEKRPFKGVGRVIFFLYVTLIPLAYFTISPLLSGRYLEMFTLVIYLGLGVSVVIGLLLFFPAFLNALASLVILPFRRTCKVAGRLAQSSMSTARLRVFSTVSGLTLVFAAVFLISGVMDSLMSETVSWADRNLVNCVFIRGKDKGAVKDEELKNIPGVKAVLNLSAVIRYPFPVRGIAAEELEKIGYPAEQGDWIIVSSRLARTYHLEVGDRLRLATPMAGAKAFTIRAVHDEYGFYPDDRTYAVISEEKMESYFCVAPDPGTRWSLYLDDKASAGAVKSELTRRLGDRARITTGLEKKQEYVDDLSQSFAIFNVISTLVALLSGVSILNSLVIAIVERRRETALLRVVGLTPAQLKGILALEALSLGTLGGFFGVILGWPLTVLTVQSLKRISYLDMDVTVEPQTVIITFLGALLVSMAASVYPMVRQGATDLMEAVKYE